MPDRSPPLMLAIANQKGGVGKTTTAINLGASLAKLDKRTLLIDMDPQGNASTGLGLMRSERSLSSYDILMGSASLSQVIVPTSIPSLDLVPATPDLSSVDIQLATETARVRRLRAAITSEAVSSYDFILLDCPPSLNLLTINALVASEAVLVPLQCEFFALEGITQLLKTISEIRSASNSRLRTQGVVLTMYDQRTRLTSDVEADVRETLGELVFDTVIPRNVRLSEAPSHGLPALHYDPRSSGAMAYLDLARELLARV